MQTLRFLSKLTLGLALGFTLISCGSDDDPAPTGGGGGGGGGTGGGTGTISATCTTSTSGSGSFVINGVNSQGGMIVTGVCQGSAANYSASITDSTERDIVISFRGMPNSGTFNIKNLFDYSASSTVADCYIAVDNVGSTYSSKTATTKITVTRSSSSIRIQLPEITLDRLSSSGPSTIPVQADFTINL